MDCRTSPPPDEPFQIKGRMDHPVKLKKQSTHHSSLEDLSCKSDHSKGHPVNFSDQQTSDWSAESCSSGRRFKSDGSMGHPINLEKHHSSLHDLHALEDTPVKSKVEAKGFQFSSLQRHVSAPTGSQPKELSLHESSPMSIRSHKDDGRFFEKSPKALLSPGSDHSLWSIKSDFLDSPLSLKNQHPSYCSSMESLSSDFSIGDQNQLNSILRSLKGTLAQFVENELQKFNSILQKRHQEWPQSSMHAGTEQENEKAFLKIALSFLRQMNHSELADLLETRTSVFLFQHNLKCSLMHKYQCVFEGIAKAGNPTYLNEIYIELYISEEATEVNDVHEVRKIETAFRNHNTLKSTVQCNNIFEGDGHHQIRTVLTKGVAGIGKTVLTQKFTLDWAEGKANQDKYFVFPLTFRQLNLLKDKMLSLVELIHHFFGQTKDVDVSSFHSMQVVLILDGLDECRLPLDFQKTRSISSISESALVEELLVNIIRGDLLPSALIWITTRPAAASLIPAQFVSLVTEVSGFMDLQKDQYFKNKFPEDEALKVISHIKSSQCMYALCYLPIFCWIAATILQSLIKTRPAQPLPKTLTEMYIHFLVVQAKVKNVKYNDKSETDQHWSPENSEMIKSLGKLAFEQLEKGNLIFYESDLKECGIDITAASVYSGVFTEIFKEESGLYQDKVYCFVHLSVQEFLAAFHVHLTFFTSGVNLLSEDQSPVKPEAAERLFYQTAIDKALQSHNGHLDLFLRFLLGLSLSTNQNLLQGLLPKPSSCAYTETIKFINKKLSENVSLERYINLFHCLAELNDRSLVNKIHWHLKSGHFDGNQLSASEWSALIFILMSTEKEVLDLKEYCASEEGLKRLLPVVKASKKALLSGCSLTSSSCSYLSSLLSSTSCCLKELDLSNNNLTDLGMKELALGLKSPHCKLEILRLSGCCLTEEGCSTLASALKLNHSHLQVLDVSYNYLGNKGMKELFALQSASQSKLDTLSVDPTGRQWLIPDLLKYFISISLDQNTVNKCLQISNNKKTVTHALKDLSYEDHPDRFDYWHQVLSLAPLPDRCYQEVEWTGEIEIGIAYRRLQRKGTKEVCRFGANDHSWRLRASTQQSYLHYNKTKVPVKPIGKKRVGIYVDYSAGVLSFFSVSLYSRIHLRTINTTFREPLYLGFGLRLVPPPLVSSVSLCDLSDELPAVFTAHLSPVK